MGTETKSLSETERERIATAIAQAEAATAGEIYCVLARSSDGYFYPAAFMLALIMALLAPLVAGALLLGWYAITPLWFALGHLCALLAACAMLLVFPGLRIRLVPRRLRYQRAQANALRQFMSRNIHHTQDRTGVLIFVSLAERYVEVVADTAIDEKVAQQEWDKIVAGLVEAARQGSIAEGLVQAVGAAGVLLARHVPALPGDRNELDDHIAEI